MRDGQLFRLDPNPKLVAYHHSQEAEQGNDGRRRTLHPDQTVQNPYTQTNYKGYEQDSHYLSPTQIRLEISKNWDQLDEQKGCIVCLRVRTRALWAESRLLRFRARLVSRWRKRSRVRLSRPESLSCRTRANFFWWLPPSCFRGAP